MIGGAGNDTYFVDNMADQVVEGSGGGRDAIWTSVDYTLPDNVEIVALSGSTDIKATGNGLANTLLGNDGNNRLDGQGGADVMIGGQGNDTYVVDNAGDQVIEAPGGGADALYSSVSFLLPDNVESLYLFGTAVAGVGNALDNVIEGTAQDNIIDGRGGADIMIGHTGNDTYVVDNVGDQVIEAAGEGHDVVYATISHVLEANVEDLYLAGGGNIGGTGNTDANAIFGNSGNNAIDGGAGADILTGGAGNDRFLFRAGQANGDVVTDFQGNGGTGASGDLLVFSGYGPGATFTQDDATHWMVDGNGHHDVITLSNAATLHAGDWLFV
jgi:Ca2+-binding RTX toxin-like protein